MFSVLVTLTCSVSVLTQFDIVSSFSQFAVKNKATLSNRKTRRKAAKGLEKMDLAEPTHVEFPITIDSFSVQF